MRSSISKVIAVGNVSPLVALRRARDVVTNTAASYVAGTSADTLMELENLLELVCNFSE
jgi:hypothetical protein